MEFWALMGWMGCRARPRPEFWTVRPGRTKIEAGREGKDSSFSMVILGEVMTDFLSVEPSGMFGTQW